jgi:hypothetical protein
MLEVKANDMSEITFVNGKGKVFPVQDMKASEGVEAEFRAVLTLAVCGE